MLNAYQNVNGQLAQSPIAMGGPLAGHVWLDLLNPTAEEDGEVERLLGIDIPSKAEMEEIELSARLYHEEGAEFMTMTGLIKLDS